MTSSENNSKCTKNVFHVCSWECACLDENTPKNKRVCSRTYKSYSFHGATSLEQYDWIPFHTMIEIYICLRGWNWWHPCPLYMQQWLAIVRQFAEHSQAVCMNLELSSNCEQINVLNEFNWIFNQSQYYGRGGDIRHKIMYFYLPFLFQRLFHGFILYVWQWWWSFHEFIILHANLCYIVFLYCTKSYWNCNDLFANSSANNKMCNKITYDAF